MAAGKEIRAKINSVGNTKKITKAMEMVAGAKMRKAQERMRLGRPYADKVRNITIHLSQANPEYRHPFMMTPATPQKRVGLIIISTDKGLCGGLNTNTFREVTNKLVEWNKEGVSAQAVTIGSKGSAFFKRIGVEIVGQVSQLGELAQIEKVVGPCKTIIDEFIGGGLDAVYLCYSRFINTMKQEPVVEQLLPLGADRFVQGDDEKKAHSWDYIYEPDAQSVIDYLMKRYVEALVYQALAENMASEQSARRVAMQAATDNADTIINELNLVYNKTRQAAITTELTEIVAGAAAVSG